MTSIRQWLGDLGLDQYADALHRFDGELWLASGEHDKAEQCFRAAIERARPQQAKLWELRASVALARLWTQQGKRKEARNLLAPVYDWFTEGFGTPDLLDAKALLEELAASLRSAGSHTL